jgi:hypothetical protein
MSLNGHVSLSFEKEQPVIGFQSIILEDSKHLVIT